MKVRIHKEGYRTLLLVGGGLAITDGGVWLFSAWSPPVQIGIYIASILLFLFFLQFFRDPQAHLEPEPGVVYAPAEGKITSIQEITENECLNTRCVRISIFMSPFNVHINRSPITGEVAYFAYHKGKHIISFYAKSSAKNEHTTLLISNEKGQKVLVRQIAGLTARRICHYADVGDKLQAGEQFGFIKFGSRVDIFLPLETQILAQVGDKAVCGITPLAKLSEVTQA